MSQGTKELPSLLEVLPAHLPTMFQASGIETRDKLCICVEMGVVGWRGQMIETGTQCIRRHGCQEEAGVKGDGASESPAKRIGNIQCSAGIVITVMVWDLLETGWPHPSGIQFP